MSTIVTGYKNTKDMLLKGAPDRVIEKCTKFMSFEGTKEMTAQNKKELLEQISKLASEGLRCLAIAEIPNAGVLSDITEQNKIQRLGDISKYNEYEQGATFVGCVCIRDPVRPECKPAIKACKTAGIRVIMITGDSKETAQAIAKELDIIESSDDLAKCVFTGTQFEKMSKNQR